MGELFLPILERELSLYHVLEQDKLITNIKLYNQKTPKME